MNVKSFGKTDLEAQEAIKLDKEEWRLVVWYKFTDVSKERTTSIFSACSTFFLLAAYLTLRP
jgi:hypothetical protein